MAKVFACSDLHFGHDNIIRFCSRPFKNSHDMDTALVERWNNRVDPKDIVYFLGDFSMGPRSSEALILEMLHSLNGEKLVILGNHDQPNKRHKSKGLKQIILDNQSSLEIAILPDIYEMSLEGTNFVMCHYPMNDWNGKFHGAVHLHGHQHNGWSASRAREQAAKKRYDVGVDMYGGPVQITGDCRYLNDPKGWK